MSRKLEFWDIIAWIGVLTWTGYEVVGVYTVLAEGHWIWKTISLLFALFMGSTVFIATAEFYDLIGEQNQEKEDSFNSLEEVELEIV